MPIMSTLGNVTKRYPDLTYFEWWYVRRVRTIYMMHLHVKWVLLYFEYLWKGLSLLFVLFTQTYTVGGTQRNESFDTKISLISVCVNILDRRAQLESRHTHDIYLLRVFGSRQTRCVSVHMMIPGLWPYDDAYFAAHILCLCDIFISQSTRVQHIIRDIARSSNFRSCEICCLNTVSLWNLICASAAAQRIRLSNFETIGQSWKDLTATKLINLMVKRPVGY